MFADSEKQIQGFLLNNLEVGSKYTFWNFEGNLFIDFGWKGNAAVFPEIQMYQNFKIKSPAQRLFSVWKADDEHWRTLNILRPNSVSG